MDRGSRSRPSATASCISTRSTPCTSSVTGCSTWRRVFISRKKNRSVVGLVEELDGAGPAVVDGRGGGGARRRAARGAWPRTDPGAGDSSTTFWCRRWIEQSRSPSTRTPSVVTDDLDLDVPAVLDVRLDEHGAVAEGRRGLGAGRGRPHRAGRRAADDPHAAAAATGGRLHQQGKVGLGDRVDVLVAEHRHAGRFHELLGGDLGAHLVDGLRRRADPDQAGVDDGAGEVGVLGEEAVARVDRVGTRPAGGVERRGRRAGTSRPGTVPGSGTAVSASRTNGRSASASEWTATVSMPRRRQVAKTRRAISPRLATSSFVIIGPPVPRSGSPWRCSRGSAAEQ